MINDTNTLGRTAAGLSNAGKDGGVLGVILARAGSRGLPGKAMRPLLGKPVIAYSFAHALKSRRLDRVIVTSDDGPILTLAAECGLATILRPPELCTDTAATDPVLRHAVETLRAQDGYRPRIVVMLYGNVPIRRNAMIDRAVDMLEQSDFDSVQTVAPVGKMHPYWMFWRDDDGLINKYVPNTVYRRQELPPLFSPTGAVYAVRTEVLMAAERQADPHAFLGQRRGALEVAADDSVDIDTAVDLLVAEALLKMEATA